VWSLETQKKVNEYQICPTIYGTDIWGIPSCIKFSELNSDKIYISGEFSQNNEETDQHSGLFIYSISENKIIDSTFGVGSERIYGSKFTFFEKENKAMATNGIYLYIINYKDSKIEYKTMLNANIPIYDKIIYNNTNDYFISYCEYLITKVGYKNNTSVVEKIGIIDSVYPNPTTNDVIVKFDCEQAQISYKILNINSKILAENTAYLQNKSLTFDFSSYSAGVYFIQLTCENLIFTYKIIKDN
nr:T9SS type A sorting domain-containing protein [Candidatus Kapabacteria bacterium]